MTNEELDRERLETDISLLGCAQLAPGLPEVCSNAVDRAIARLRSELAKLDGPAPGFTRVRFAVSQSPTRRGALFSLTFVQGDPNWDLGFHGSHIIAVVTADIQIPRVVEVEGKVEK